MNDYYLVRFEMSPCVNDECDILSALLCGVGFESFVTDETGVSAYVKKELYDEDAVRAALTEYDFKATIALSATLIPGQDWNSEWEKHYFQPIVFEDRCVVHSSFHKDYPKAEYDIVIDPRMAFGTGHHETTSLMVERLLENELTGMRVLDMGTGTGILAILSAMRGAERVVGVEIDPPAYENATDNIGLNGTPRVELRLGGAETVAEEAYFDYVLANINRNIILEDIGSYAKALRTNGYMVLSGFYKEDVPMIEEAAAACGLHAVSVRDKNRWANLMLRKSGNHPVE